MSTLLFLHGYESGPNGRKSQYLRSSTQHYTHVLTPSLSKFNMFANLCLVYKLLREEKPDIVVASSWGSIPILILILFDIWRGPTIILGSALFIVPYLNAKTFPADAQVYFVHAKEDKVCPVEMLNSGSGKVGSDGATTAGAQRLLIVENDQHPLNSLLKDDRLNTIIQEELKRWREELKRWRDACDNRQKVNNQQLPPPLLNLTTTSYDLLYYALIFHLSLLRNTIPILQTLWQFWRHPKEKSTRSNKMGKLKSKL